MAKQQLPLEAMLTAIDTKDREWYNRLQPDEKKLFSAWMMQRYVSNAAGPNAASYLYFTNHLVNTNFSEVSKHPELQWLMFTAVGQGKKERHQYLKPPNTKQRKDKVGQFIADCFPLMKHDEIDLLREINTVDELKELAKKHGLDSNSIKEIFRK